MDAGVRDGGSGMREIKDIEEDRKMRREEQWCRRGKGSV